MLYENAPNVSFIPAITSGLLGQGTDEQIKAYYAAYSSPSLAARGYKLGGVLSLLQSEAARRGLGTLPTYYAGTITTGVQPTAASFEAGVDYATVPAGTKQVNLLPLIALGGALLVLLGRP